MCKVVVVDFGNEIDWIQMADGTVYVDITHVDELMSFIDTTG